MKTEGKTPRQIRREKQRAGNAGRARKMHEARLAWKQGNERKEEGKLADSRTVHVGCSGWFYWQWKGVFYPAALPTRDWFVHYARRFDTVELNAPFYSWPTMGTVRTWVRQAGRRKFVYTVKAPELITHLKRFEGTRTLIRDFGHVADVLGPRMGCFLFQLPPGFHYSPARLRRILEQLDPARRSVVEFRHGSWWNERVYAAFRAAGVIFCSCSGPKLPDELVVTGEEIYLRFHGPTQWYRHDYSREELAPWARRALNSGAKRIWAYFNNDYEGNAIRNARMFRRMLMED